MSRIDRLTIRGIRGFGPEKDDTQSITFTPPLTLILGHNGAGKSTIIECLRMMTTNDMPPGQGQCFVHDPTLSGKVTTHAKVAIQLTDAKDRTFDISKIFTLSKKDRTFKFATNDTNILNRQTNENLSSKCFDVNQFMSQTLNVPKAVLQNVIFCHHIDSDWPLGEGKALKERFDAIFSATKYVEVLDVLNKERKEVKARIAQLEVLKKPYLENLSNYNKDLESIARKKANLQRKQTELESIRKDEKEVSDRRIEIEKKYHEVANIEQDFKRHAENYKACKERITELRSNVNEVMDRSRESLEDELRDFDAKMDERKKSVENSKGRIKGMKEDTEKKRRELQNGERTLAEYEAEHRQHQQTIKKLMVDLRNLGKALGANVEVLDDDFKNQKIEAHTETFDDSLTKMERQIAARRQEFSDKLEALQEDIRKGGEEKATLKAKLETLKSKQDDILMEMAAKEQEIKEISSIDDKVAKFDKTLKKMNEELSELQEKSSGIDSDALAEQISQLNEKEADLNIEMNASSKNSSVKNKVKALEEQIAKKASSVNNLKVRIQSELKEPFKQLKIEIPQKEWARVVRKNHTTVDAEVIQTRRILETKNKQLTKCQTELDIKEKELKRLQKRLKELREKIDDEVGVESTLEQTLIETEEELNEVRNRDSIFIGTQHVYKKYKDKINKQKASRSNQCCPLCDRSMQDKEVKELEIKLEKLMKEIPRIRETSEQEVVTVSEKLSRLNLLKRDDEERNQIETDQLPSLESQVEKSREELVSLKAEISDLSGKLESQSVIATKLNSQIGNCDLFDSGNRELETLRNELRKEQANLEEDVRDFDDVMEDFKDIKEKKSTLEKQLKTEQDCVQEISKLQLKMGETKNQRLELLNKAGAGAQLKQDIQKLENENHKIEAELPTTEASLIKAGKTLAEKESSRTKISRKQEGEISEMQGRLVNLKQNRQEIGRTLRLLEEYEQSDKESRLQDSKAKISQLKSEVTSMNESAERMEQETHRKELEIRSGDTRRRELSDNIAILDKEEQLKKLKEIVNEKKQVLLLHNSGEENISEILSEIKEKHETLKADELTTASDVRNMENTLQEEEARAKKIGGNAEKEYKDWLAESQTEKHVARDLDVGYTALNKAILAFHQEKMTQINRLIANYWIRVYKGNDIDKIQIMFSDDTGSSKTSTKRSYQYRVVMVRQGVEQDMRSRCSAGQRVLACLIVRLALAEAFCDGCAMLALDEPTTNLDHENMMSLASILAEIVRERREEKNFQMVIITHDEEFILALTKNLEDVGEVKYYYKIEKNDENLSTIKKRKIDVSGI